MSSGTFEEVKYIVPFVKRGEITYDEAVEFIKNENGGLSVNMERALGLCMLTIAQGNCPRYSNEEISTR